MQKNWLDVILIALAVYRLTRLITMEDGPFDWAVKSREWIFARFNEGHWLNKGLSCPWCVSFWLAVIVLALPAELWLWFGIAGAASLLFSWEIK